MLHAIADGVHAQIQLHIVESVSQLVRTDKHRNAQPPTKQTNLLKHTVDFARVAIGGHLPKKRHNNSKFFYA